ncbi:MAG: cyclic nucleotide-binding domain-containing protein [Candidatus Brocadia sp.]|nr:MAG: cyclic nucleotide-binding domain-containing protein [Candidatus Brocadia sp.]
MGLLRLCFTIRQSQGLENVNNKQVLVGTLKTGDIFGEMSFFGMAKRTASVTADGDVVVGMITKDTFMEAINKLSRSTRQT